MFKNFCRTGFLLLLGLGLQAQAAVTTPAACEAAQLKAAAKMCLQVLNCEATYLKKPTADPRRLGLESCESKALQRFDLAYAKAIATAAASTPPVDCPQEQSEEAIDSRLRADLKDLREYLRTGWDKNDLRSTTLYSGIVKAEAVYCNKLLNAEAKDALLPNDALLGDTQAAAGNALESKVNALAATALGSGLTYGGSADDDLGAALHTGHALADILGGNLTPNRLAAGGVHTCTLLGDGGVKCWGLNGSGQLGLGDTSNRGDGLNEMGDTLLPVNLGSGRTARQVVAGNSHTCALLDNGGVKCWGQNDVGQLGLGDVSNRGDAASEMGDTLLTVNLGAGRTARQIVAGWGHTCALLDDGGVKCWGYNEDGELGLGDNSLSDPTKNRGDSADEMDSLPKVDLGAGRTATQIAAGNGHTCALLDDGGVKCWGNNGTGQLGLGTTTPHGDSAATGHEMGALLPSVSLGAGRTARQVVAGNSHTCALLDNGSVKCWGNNGTGQLGLGTSTPHGDDSTAGSHGMGDLLPSVSLGAGRTARQVVARERHTCALLDDGSVKCWGDNSVGQLGLGDINNRGDGANEMGDSLPTAELGAGRTARQVVGGGLHTCALLDNGGIKCWGNNFSGQLGLGDNSNSDSTKDRGDVPNEMGFYLPAVDLGQ